MSYFIVLTLYLLNTELISIFLLNNELRTPPHPGPLKAVVTSYGHERS